MADLTYEADGAVRHDRAALSSLDALEHILTSLSANRAGIRLQGIAGLAELLSADRPIGAFAVAHSGPAVRPVRAILFDKTPGTNWALGWHQDRTIAVRPTSIRPMGFGPWTIKAGLTHVEPPFSLLESMVTVRVHLDPVPESNAPLLIAPGSHRHGRIAEQDIADTVASCGTVACLAERGDVWLYATPILHASAAATGATHRRVLQVDYSVGPLPDGLEWLGV